MRFYVIWRRPDNTYYYRYVKGTYKEYYEGYFNQYGHEIVLIINRPEIIKRDNYIKKKIKFCLYWLYKKL